MERCFADVTLCELAEWEGKVKDGERCYKRKQRGNHVPQVAAQATLDVLSGGCFDEVHGSLVWQHSVKHRIDNKLEPAQVN